ncbi:MAG TPA: cation diffusion facilitator family transporter [Pseudobdellovibrionaceae bacterium]|nr:cation diffusion facilitator family transporter [Pseudobdellovibrionaceae bacterium]
MGKSCCEAKSAELAKLREKQGTVLKWVLGINALMFVVEFTFGWLSRSSALMADSLDMFGDAAVYGFSLFALNRGAIWRARAGLSKGVIMAIFGFVVLGQATYRFLTASVPVAETMGVIGAVALAANAICLVLLYNHRADDINMRSTWLCSRNDIVSNVGVIVASVLVGLLNSGWPDLIVGFAIAALFLKSSYEVVTEAKEELRLSVAT